MKFPRFSGQAWSTSAPVDSCYYVKDALYDLNNVADQVSICKTIDPLFHALELVKRRHEAGYRAFHALFKAKPAFSYGTNSQGPKPVRDWE